MAFRWIIQKQYNDCSETKQVITYNMCTLQVKQSSFLKVLLLVISCSIQGHCLLAHFHHHHHHYPDLAQLAGV